MSNPDEGKPPTVGEVDEVLRKVKEGKPGPIIITARELEIILGAVVRKEVK